MNSNGEWVNGGRVQTMERRRRVGQFKQNWMYGTSQRYDEDGIIT